MTVEAKIVADRNETDGRWMLWLLAVSDDPDGHQRQWTAGGMDQREIFKHLVALVGDAFGGSVKGAIADGLIDFLATAKVHMDRNPDCNFELSTTIDNKTKDT